MSNMTDTDKRLVEHIRQEARRRLPEGEVCMTEDLLPWAWCLNLIGVIDRLAASDPE